jgi:hypothetical protein
MRLRAAARLTCIVTVGLVCLASVSPGPREIARMDQRPIVVRLPDRTLAGWFIDKAGGSQQVSNILSNDNGGTWSAPRAALPLPGGQGEFYGLQPLATRDGEVHLFLIHMAKAGDAFGGEGERVRHVDWRDRHLDIWHTRSTRGRSQWRTPRMIWSGYTGALNSAVELRNGRILLPFSYVTKRDWRRRGEGFDEFTFVGTFDSIALYSDDQGETFRLSTPPLKVETPDIVSAYGAVEPVVIELKDGRVWMLIRTQRERFYESFSPDGAHWSEPQPSPIASSDSPAGLTRTDDGRLVLVWNNCRRFPYAYGGRHVLHAAISADEGRTWAGYREVLRDPKLDQPPPPGGDFGTAYPFPLAVVGDRILISSGQGAGRVRLVAFDAAWLTDTGQRTNLDDWTYFGCRGVERTAHPDKRGRFALKVAKTDSAWPAGAVWNFPNQASGRLLLRLKLNAGFQGSNIALTDHYSPPWDKEDALDSLYNLPIDARGRLLGTATLNPGRWYNLEVRWSGVTRQAAVLLNGRKLAVIVQRRETAGANYLRVRSTASGADQAGLLIESVETGVSAGR